MEKFCAPQAASVSCEKSLMINLLSWYLLLKVLLLSSFLQQDRRILSFLNSWWLEHALGRGVAVNPFRLRNTVKMTLLHFWKVIYLCKRVRPCPTVTLLSKGRKRQVVNISSWEGRLWREQVFFSLQCTGQGHLAKHSVHTCACPQRSCCTGHPPLGCPGEILKYLAQQYKSTCHSNTIPLPELQNSYSSIFQCSSLQTNASFETRLYLINFCGYEACISDEDQQILVRDFFLLDKKNEDISLC